MKVDILGSYGGSTKTTNLTSLLIDDFLALDAGSLTQTLTLDQQALISDVFISHTHLDHTLSLPFLVDNMFDVTVEPLRIWSTAHVIQALKTHVFNEVVWPDFSNLPSPEKPSMMFHPFVAGQVQQIRHLQVTPIQVQHVVPCTGFVVTSLESQSSIVFTSDTTSSDAIWEAANHCPNLKAVIVDCSFPNEMRALAEVSGHMTPLMLAHDLKKLKVDCDVLVYHIKPNFSDQLQRELAALGHPRLRTTIEQCRFDF